MLWLYRVLFLPVLVVLSPYYLWRMFRRGGYGGGFVQRFGAHPGLAPKKPGVRRIWVQAVSVGEILAVEPVLRELRKQAGVELVVTTTTSTGYVLASLRCRESAAYVGYFPLDFALFSRRAWRVIDPDLAVLMEGELWPEHLHQAGGAGVPVALINARLSDRSFQRLRSFPGAGAALFGSLAAILAATRQDKERFLSLGAAVEKVQWTGNLKLDVPLRIMTDEEKAALRVELGLRNRPLLVGASTWPGEERALIDAWKKLRAGGIEAGLLIVPRHAERRSELEEIVRGERATYHLRSRGPAKRDVDIAIGDTTGELSKLLQVADLAFVGKSLPPHREGQTPIEAAALGVPILFGPGMGNFREISRDLLAAGAAREVADRDALLDTIATLFPAGAERARMGKAGREWHSANSGAVSRTADRLLRLL